MKNSQIKKLIDKHDVISFDIFDTLLLRGVMQPEHVFNLIENMSGKHGFAQARLLAEHKFYDKYGTGKEANLDDIYLMIPDFEAEKEIELNLEYEGLVENPEIKALYDYAIKKNKRVIITSDMYLPKKFLEKVLKKNNISGYYKFYLSNDINHRKSKGDIYDFITQDIATSPKKFLHIGDNKQSDYEQATKHGWTAVLYNKPSQSFLKNDTKFFKFYSSNRSSLDASVITALISQHKGTNDYWYNFGYKYAGPIAYAYAMHIYKAAQNQELNKILFVARDGYLIEKVFNTLNKSNIKTDYVYAPRVLNYTANLDYDPTLPEQPKIICNYFGIDTKGISPQKYIEDNINTFRELAYEEKIKTGYDKYIKALVEDEKEIGIVDTISGQLSAQKLIEKTAGIKTTGFYVLTLPGREIVNKMSHIDFFTENLQKEFKNKRRPDIIELIFSAPENPIITMKDGKPVYQNVSNPAERKRHEIYRKIESGVLAFTKDIVSRFGNSIEFTQNTIFNLINVYLDYPNDSDIKAMYSALRSPYADNSLYVPILSAPYHFWQIKEMKELIWLSKWQKIWLTICQPILIKIRGLKSIKLIFFPTIKKSILKFDILNKYGIYIGDINE